MSILFLVLLALSVVVLVGAEWPRLEERFGSDARRRRERARTKETFTLVRSDTEEFAASVERDLQSLPTIEREENGRP